MTVGNEAKPAPGCMTQSQVQALVRILPEKGTSDPSLLSALEGTGPVADLENAFAEAAGACHALSVSSCTAALHLALLVPEAGPGHEIIVSPYSWPQSVAPVLFTGATPVFADIDPHTWTIDPDSVARLITHKTKAIVAVHLFGCMADMPQLEAISKAAGVALIADAAHAAGASLNGRAAGSWGDIACFSLGRGKLVSGGEGGILATNNSSLFERAVTMSQHPERVFRMTGNTGTGLGLNYRIHPLAAILALVDLGHIDRKLRQRRQVYEAFFEAFGESEILAPQSSLPGSISTYYSLPLHFKGKPADRDILIGMLRDNGVPATPGPYGTPLHLRLSQSQWASRSHPTHAQGACPIAEDRCAREVQILSAIDMDDATIEEAFDLGAATAKVAAEFLNLQHAEAKA